MRICPICDKQSAMAGTRKLLRGHYNLTKRSRKYPNLQWVVLSPAVLKKLGATKVPPGKRVLVCTKCIKALGKKK